MKGNSTAVVLMLAFLALAGCSSSTQVEAEGTGETASNVPGPEAVVHEFLEAMRTGNAEKAGALLTPLAKQKTTEAGLSVGLNCSQAASFKVKEVEHVSEDGAHVATEWSDIDEQGQPHTDPIVWMLRREKDGWRVAGMATKVFADELPIILNFEDPNDMVRKQELAEEEMRRRETEEAAQAKAEGSAETPVSR